MRKIIAGIAALSLLALGGCFETYKLSQSVTPQATQYQLYHGTLNHYLRSTTAYEGFITRAHFDALLMSNSMRHMYTAMHSKKVGFSPQEEEGFLQRQLEENNQYITIYLLAEINDKNHVSMNDEHALWSVYLEDKNGKRIMPVGDRGIYPGDFPPEIISMFGDRFLLCKVPYRLRFPSKDLSGKQYFSSGDTLKLVCAGSGISSSISWEIKKPLTYTELKKMHAVKPKEDAGIFGFLKTLTRPRERKNDDFYW